MKWLEASGARVIPLVPSDSWADTEDKVSRLNGVLFPGGDGDYLEIGDHIYKSLVQENDAGNFYPLWGTCLGFENLATFASDAENPLSSLVSEATSLTLDFLVDPTKTRMFDGIDAD